MGRRYGSGSNRIGAGRRIGIVFCSLGILAGLFIAFVADNHPLFMGLRTVFYVATPPGWSVFGVGLIIIGFFVLGLIGLVGSGLAKSTAARILFNSINIVVLAVVGVVGYGVYAGYQDGQQQERLAQAERDSILQAAEQGDTRAQIDVGANYYSQWQYSGSGDPGYCPEALYWYQRAAYQGDGYGQHLVGVAYGQCAPGMRKNNAILAYIWDVLAAENRAGTGYYRGVGDPKADLGLVLAAGELDDAKANAEPLIDSARILFADANMSAADRQTAIEVAFQELLPAAN